MLKSITFEVVGEQRIHCASCEERVTRLLKTLEGVGQVRAHAETQRIDVLYDTGVVEPCAIGGRLSDAGYETRLA